VLLQVKQVSFAHGPRQILKSVTLSANHGELIAILGTNGTGKSTLLDIIAGIRQPGEGSIDIDGKPRQHWTFRELARKVSHLPQSVNASLPFSAGQVVAMGRYPHTDSWFESEADHQAVDRAMARTNCVSERERNFGTLSGGERQRVLLAACLAQQADLLLLDEPSTFLDIEQQLHCFTLLREEAEAGRLCLAVTHDLNLALAYSTRLIVLAGGNVAFDLGATEALKDSKWLAHFSERLRLGITPEGAPWIRYR
jgi:iron complex transport system ATP-binding protein